MDINTRLYGVTELKAKDALRTMDIKTRIDALSEAEAKAALKWYVNQLPVHIQCFECDCRYCRVRDCYIWTEGGYEKCVENILKHSLKEATV